MTTKSKRCTFKWREKWSEGHLPAWGWWRHLGCGRWWWCQTWRRRRPARWCTPLRHSCPHPSRGPWSCPRPSPPPTTRERASGRNLPNEKSERRHRMWSSCHVKIVKYQSLSASADWGILRNRPTHWFLRVGKKIVFPGFKAWLKKNGVEFFLMDTFGENGYKIEIVKWIFAMSSIWDENNWKP